MIKLSLGSHFLENDTSDTLLHTEQLWAPTLSAVGVDLIINTNSVKYMNDEEYRK